MFLQYVDFTIETKNRTNSYCMNFTVLELHVNNNKFLINTFLIFGIYHIFPKDVKGFCQPCFCFDRKRILFWEREHCSVSHTYNQRWRQKHDGNERKQKRYSIKTRINTCLYWLSEAFNLFNMQNRHFLLQRIVRIFFMHQERTIFRHHLLIV